MSTQCAFCRKIEEGSTRSEGLLVHSFEPLNPVTQGHRLFVTQKHLQRPGDDPMLASLAFASAARYAAEQGCAYNLIVNAGSAATQTILHVHVHYVPRREGDGLSLPWTGSEDTEQ